MDLEIVWRERTDGDVAAAAKHLSEYTEDAQRVIAAEAKRRGISLDTSKPTVADHDLPTVGWPRFWARVLPPAPPNVPAQDLPISWLRFWIWVRLPGGAILTLLAAGRALEPRSVMEPRHPVEPLVIVAYGVAIVVPALIVAVGLQKRLLWAWKANFCLIVIDVLLGPLKPASRGVNISEVILLYGAGVAFFCLVWLWPNAVYFRKRRYLFASGRAPNATSA